MKTYLLFIITIFFASHSYAQKYYTKTGKIDFEASVEVFEPVIASHDNVTSVLDTSNGQVAILALVKGFRFRNALMEEHFNENYIESDTYPNASFKGTIVDFSIENLENKSSYELYGILTLHGESKKIKTTIILNKVDDVIVLSTDFSVDPNDFDIGIPGVVSNKIAETTHITSNFNLVKR